MNWIKIDNIGFNVDSVRKMSEGEFLEQYKDHRPLNTKEADWKKWCKDAYATIVPKKAKPSEN